MTESSDRSDSVDPVQVEPDDRLDRRAALKVAVGGAVAGAAWAAPRIEGLSVAPDYAAAATCSGGTIPQVTKNSNNCGFAGDTECWGNNCCGNWGYSATAASRFTLNGNIGGNVNLDNGSVTMTVNGIDPPFQRCTVNVAGNCNNDGSFRGGGTFTFNNNGNQNAFIDCQGGGNYYQDDPDGQIRINMSCVCL